MNLYHLRYFVELAHTRHYTRAAERLCITQPSLSHAIAQLERELGVPVIPVAQDGYELLDAMCGISSGLPRQELPREETEYYQYNP